MTPNARGLPQTVSHGTYVQDTHAWDRNGNLTNLTDTRGSVIQPRTRSETYDARDRVVTTTYAYNGRTFNYGYDLLDNLRTTSETPGGRNHRHDYATNGRLTRIFNPAASSTSVIGYAHDDRGNATSRTSATGFVPNTTSIAVDEASRVRSATVGTDTESFTYDGLGRRTRVTVGATTAMHFYSQAGQLLLWESPSNVAKSQQHNIYLGTKRIARRHSTGPVYVHTDHLGSPLAETSVVSVTLVSSSQHWEPYGAPAGGAFWGALQYAGHYQDGTTRLTYMQQRYYDLYAGRFLAVDPVATNPGSFNRYWYANNNPYKYKDPDGRVPVAIAGCAAAPACAGAVLAGAGAAIAGLKASGGSTPPVLPAAILGPSIVSGVIDLVQQNAGESGSRENPYEGPVNEPVIVVDGDGNAIPVGAGEQIGSSVNEKYQQVKDATGRPTGIRMDKGGHKTQADPKAQAPHVHRPGVTDDTGNKHLPLNEPTKK